MYEDASVQPSTLGATPKQYPKTVPILEIFERWLFGSLFTVNVSWIHAAHFQISCKNLEQSALTLLGTLEVVLGCDGADKKGILVWILS